MSTQTVRCWYEPIWWHAKWEEGNLIVCAQTLEESTSQLASLIYLNCGTVGIQYSIEHKEVPPR